MPRSITAEHSVAEIVKNSRILTGKSNAIDNQSIPLSPARGDAEVIYPWKQLGLRGRSLKSAQITRAMQQKGFDPAHLLELLIFAEFSGEWDGYTSIWAFGQAGRHQMYGKEAFFYPKLWGGGTFHDLGITGVDSIWSDTDALLVVSS